MWQTQGLETLVFGSVAMIGLTGEFSDVWQGKDLGDRERRGHPLPALFLKRYDSKRVRGWGSVNDMIPWELGRKCDSAEEEGDRDG